MIMPVVGLVTGGADFTNCFIVLGSCSFDTLAAAQEAGVATLNYGVFINTVIEFIIIAFALFMMVRTYNRFCRKQEEAPAEPPAGSAARRNPGCPAQLRQLISSLCQPKRGAPAPLFIAPAFQHQKLCLPGVGAFSLPFAPSFVVLVRYRSAFAVPHRSRGRSCGRGVPRPSPARTADRAASGGRSRPDPRRTRPARQQGRPRPAPSFP